MSNTKGIRQTLTQNRGDVAIGKQKESKKWSTASISKCTHWARSEVGGWLQRCRRSRYWHHDMFPHSQTTAFLLISLGIQEQPENFSHASVTKSTTHLHVYPFLSFCSWYIASSVPTGPANIRWVPFLLPHSGTFSCNLPLSLLCHYFFHSL